MVRKISSKHFSTDWTTDLEDINSPNWSNGIEIIRARIESRYLIPIQQLLNSSDKIVKFNCGFLVMSIDCLLIETLNQFFLGLYTSDERYSHKNKNPEFNEKANKYAFRDFFNYSTFFPHFKNNDKFIFTFYNEIRCGLLHQAQSKTSSLINIRERNMLTLIDDNAPEKGLMYK
jgi:hypothetical protein